MRYLMICNVNPAVFGQLSQAEIGTHMASYLTFNQEAQAAGVLRNAEQAEQALGFSVTLNESKSVVTDGPSEQTRYMFGGLYILDVQDRAEAETWAAKVPAAQIGSVQVHPLAPAPTA